MRLISADGRWWWNGHGGQPMPRAVEAEPAAPATAGEQRLESSEPPPAAAPQNGNPRFMPGRYVRSRAEPPGRGVARRLYQLSGGRINLGPSAAEVRHARLLDMARTPAVDPPVHIAVASAKGRVGQSTIALLIALKMGMPRTDPL